MEIMPFHRLLHSFTLFELIVENFYKLWKEKEREVLYGIYLLCTMSAINCDGVCSPRMWVLAPEAAELRPREVT